MESIMEIIFAAIIFLVGMGLAGFAGYCWGRADAADERQELPY